MYNSTFSGAVTRHERAQAVYRAISMSASNSSMLDAVRAKLAALRQLAYGWDGYRGVAVSHENAYFAAQLLSQICGPDTPTPAIVPGAVGDLQIEWHTAHGDLELHIVRPYDVRAFVSFANYGADEELSLTRDFSQVAKWLLAITEGDGVVPAAA
ncbi:hypothetical protein [Duganella violaceipulchra]|uniref:Uncharacterized protein n=1 Tax=Duganella violaceipulchra TaxID=2849652 RepID=A0AA41HJ79_9BURK|nr:hypothetical protein [Duganella violaceicalia]MBV6325504.1 hypothetical protein [Duganella violaceicalia]MCP2012676.1 hypothetical protein [Duganella violaceicalia]